MAKKQDEILSNNYDGIQEYDNDLPRWWVWLFILTVVYGVVYVAYFHLGSSSSSEEELAKKLEDIYAMQKANTPQKPDSSSLNSLVNDSAHIAAGKVIYESKCSACHALQGQGLVGPNLTDEYWIHGGKLEEIRETIANGVLDKGMLAWKGMLTEQEIDEVTIFIKSISGTNPPNAKAPQGDRYEGDR